MFSGLTRWFNQHISLAVISADVSSFFSPLLLDVETAGGTALAAVVHQAISQANSAGSFNAGQVFQFGIEAGKKYLVDNALPDLEHAVVGVVAASVANLHATSVGAPDLVTSTTVEVPVPEATAVEVPPAGDVVQEVENDVAVTLDTAAQTAATLAGGPVLGELAGEGAKFVTDEVKKLLG